MIAVRALVKFSWKGAKKRKNSRGGKLGCCEQTVEGTLQRLWIDDKGVSYSI
jgi:hypothetical protein